MEETVASLNFEGVVRNYNAIVSLVTDLYAVRAERDSLIEALNQIKQELEELKDGAKRSKR